MDKSIYRCEKCLCVREFSEVIASPELKHPRKRIHIVESRLVRKTSLLYERRTIQKPEEAVRLVRRLYQDFDKEYVYGVFLSTKGEPVCIELLSIGTLDSAIVAPRDIIKTALLSSAAGYIIFHNHPSGLQPIPSDNDISVTKRLQEASDLMSLKLFDHIILTDINYISMRERGIIS